MQDTVGIDISKDTLDIHRQSDGRQAPFGNDRAGLMALRRWIGKTPVRVKKGRVAIKLCDGITTIDRVQGSPDEPGSFGVI